MSVKPAAPHGGAEIRDLALALVAGLGIGILSRHVLLSVELISDLQSQAWLLYFLGPVLAAAGILVAGWLRPHVPFVFEIVKFGLVGTLSTTIDLATLNSLMGLSGIFQGSLFPLLKGGSFLVALLNAYLWNRNWTFYRSGAIWEQQGVHQFSLFATAATGGLALNVAVATLVVNWVPVPAGWLPVQLANAGALAALGGTATWDFLCYKFIVFRRAQPKEAKAVGHPER